MRKLERILISLFIIGLLLQIVPMAGGSLLIVLALSTLAIVYFSGGFILFQNVRLRDLVSSKSGLGLNDLKAMFLSIGAGFFCSAIVIGVMFRVQAWPGASAMLIAGIAGMTICSAIALFFYSDKTTYPLKAILTRTAAWGVVGVLLMILSPTAILEIKYRHDQEYVKLMKEVHEHPSVEKAQERLYHYRDSVSRAANAE